MKHCGPELCPTFCGPWIVAHQAPLSMALSRQEYWSGLPSPTVGDLPDPGIQPTSLASPALAGRFITNTATWETFHCSGERVLDGNWVEKGDQERAL